MKVLIGALLNGFNAIIRKPLIVLPALLVGAVIAIAFFAVLDSFFDLLVNAVFLGNIPEGTITELPFRLFFTYSLNLTALFIAFIVSLVAIVSANFFFANFVEEFSGKKASLKKAAEKTIGEAKAIAAVIIFFLLVGALAIILFLAFASIAPASPAISLVLMTLLILAIVYISIKIAFLVPIMAIEKELAKKALEKSWEFTNKRFWATLLFLMIVAIISGIILNIGSAISDLILEDVSSTIVLAIFWAISMAYSGIAIASYYLENA